MPYFNREQIASALFALTEGVHWKDWMDRDQTFKVKSRRIKLFSDVPPNNQPWIGQAEHDEDITQVTGMPYKLILKASWIAYINTGKNKEATLSVDLNNMLDALQDAIAPKPTDPGFPKRNTLGGLVHHCYIEGSIFKDPGDIDDQGMLVVPIKILIP